MRRFSTLLFLICAGALCGCSDDASQDLAPIPVLPQQPPGDKHVETGQALMQRRRFAEAIPHFERAIERPLKIFDRSEVLSTIGNCYSELEQFEKSLVYHEQALQENPRNHAALVNKGIVHRLMGDFESAERSYQAALKIAPNYAEAHMSIGALAIHQEKYELAITHLERASKLNDSLPIGHSNLAIAYAILGRFDEAELELESAIIRGYHQPEVIRDRIDKLKLAATAKAQKNAGENQAD